MCQVNGKAKNSTLHCSYIFNRSFWSSKPKTISGIRPRMQNLIDVGRREGGLRKWRILTYVWFFFCTLGVASRSHRKTNHDQWGLKTCVSAQGSAFWGLDDKKIKFRGQNFHKTWFLEAWRGILSRICEIFKSRYLEKYKLDQCKIWRASLGPQTGFVGGPALQNNNLKWRPPSWIFPQTLITQLPFDLD